MLRINYGFYITVNVFRKIVTRLQHEFLIVLLGEKKNTCASGERLNGAR